MDNSIKSNINKNDINQNIDKKSDYVILEFDPKRTYSVGEVFKTPSCKDNYFSEYCECCKCLGCLNHETH
jgi:hypothetical protein